MDALRWVLLLIGLGIFILVFVFSKKRNSQSDSWERNADYDAVPEAELNGITAEPNDAMSLNELAEDMRLDTVVSSEGKSVDVAILKEHDDTPSELSENELLIVFYLLEKEGGKLKGSQIIDVLESVGMRYGDMKIFHFYNPEIGNGKKSVFSIANIAEPGWFDLVSIDQMETPGVAMFMKLPGCMNAIKAFDKMLLVIEELLQTLPVVLKDDKHDIVSQQTLSHLREEVVEFDRKRSIAEKH